MDDLFSLFSGLYLPGLHSNLPIPSPEQEELLRQQKITETEPGSILQDFQIMLDLIGADGIEVSGTYHHLPFKKLAEINSRLNHPIEVAMQRPQMKSYPNIMGLYLLIRASGLSRIELRGKKHFLVIDPPVLESWNSLNATERYFNLLEAWLIYASDEALGEGRRRFERFYQNFEACLSFWQFKLMKSKTITFDCYRDQDHLAYYPSLHNLALLEMFGFLTIQSGQPEPKKGWRIKKIHRSPWGDDLFCYINSLIRQSFQAFKERLHQAESENTGFESLETPFAGEELPDQVLFGRWQTALQRFFPEWQNNLEIPVHQYQEGLYTFKISLQQIWRRISIPASCTLYDLSLAILRSVKFDDDHLHRFSFKTRFGRTLQINHPYLDAPPPYTDEFRVGDLPLRVGSTLDYIFDFGDRWEFSLLLESIEPGETSQTEPELLESEGEAPPQYPRWG